MRDDESTEDRHASGGEGENRESADGTGGDDAGGEDRRSGWRGLGVLSAFKDALEETINEARERGDLSGDRAREMFGKAADRAREAAGDARERFDFVSRNEFDALARRVSDLESRVRERLGGSAADGEDTGASGDPGG